MDPSAAKSYLGALLNRPLHIYTTDNRMFVGEFKCTDNDLNIILASTHEYRIPPPPSASGFLSPGISSAPSSSSPSASKIIKPMTPRYVGLIVVPGAHVVKIEVEGDGPWVETARATSA
ncbi:hypothetical protein MMC30_002422 [Trapelia coarctata]|nr:hypothetical protein [Trapelia coarctata]